MPVTHASPTVSGSGSQGRGMPRPPDESSSASEALGRGRPARVSRDPAANDEACGAIAIE